MKIFAVIAIVAVVMSIAGCSSSKEDKTKTFKNVSSAKTK